MPDYPTLFTLAVTHGYHGGACPDFRVLQPAETAAQLRNGRLVARERDGVLQVRFEADAGGAPRVRLAGVTLHLGLQLATPYFANYTALDAGFPRRVLRYTNAAAPRRLDAADGVAFVGEQFSHPLSRGDRPATVTLRDAAGSLLGTETVSDERGTATFDLRGRSPGLLTLREAYPGRSVTTPYYHAPELQRLDAAVLVEVTIDASFYATPAAFEIAFAPRADVLRYYVVARNYSDTDFEQLQVLDLGFTADQRPEVQFTRVAATAFTAAELPPSLIVGTGERVVLFRSQGTLARQLRPRRRLQLSRNSEVLIANLPQPGAERATSDLIVHVSKP